MRNELVGTLTDSCKGTLSGLSSSIMACSAQVRKHDLRLRMDAAIGRAPPLSDFELQVGHLLQSHE